MIQISTFILSILLVQTSQAEAIGANCIKRQPFRGTPKGTKFSDEQIVAKQIQKTHRIYAYTECNDVIGDLLSFKIILADEFKENRTDLLHRVGPQKDQKCPGYTFPTHRIYRAAIYADGNRIYGIRFLSVLGGTDIGSLRGTPAIYEFGPNQLPIGFYGSYVDSGITSLGFLTHDPECIRQIEPETTPEPQPEPEPEVWEPEPLPESQVEEEGSSAGAVVGVLLLVIVMIGAAALGYFLWRRRKKRQEMAVGTTKDTPEDLNKDGSLQINDENMLNSKAQNKIIRQSINSPIEHVGIHGGGNQEDETEGNDPQDDPKNSSQRILLPKESEELQVKADADTENQEPKISSKKKSQKQKR